MEKDYPGCRYYIGEAFKLRSVPTESIKIMISSLATSSLKQYDSAFKKWWDFSNTRHLDPYQTTIPTVLQFLTKEFQGGASYGTLNCFRSAMALIHGSGLGDDSRMTRFFKGISRERPPRAKYDSTWDPKEVLSYFKRLESNEKLSLEILSKKLVTLIALVTGHRIQTLASIDIRNIMRTDDNTYEIKISDQLKTSGLKTVQPNLIIPFFVKDLLICPASALETYLKSTKLLRNEEKKFFISTRKPHKAVGTQTLSRWIKEVLNDSGVDISKFSAYSTRHASTSAAKRGGITVDSILKMAGWSKNSQMFAKFYNRPISENKEAFALAILDPEDE